MITHLMFWHLLHTLYPSVYRVLFNEIWKKALIWKDINVELCRTIREVALSPKLIPLLRVDVHDLHGDWWSILLLVSMGKNKKALEGIRRQNPPTKDGTRVNDKLPFCSTQVPAYNLCTRYVCYSKLTALQIAILGITNYLPLSLSSLQSRLG